MGFLFMLFMLAGKIWKQEAVPNSFTFFLRSKDERMWKNPHYKKIQMSAAQLVTLWTK